MGSRSHWGGILLSLFSRDNLTSVLSLAPGSARLLLYTIPVPLAAQMPTLPTLPIPIKPPAAGGKGAGGGERQAPAQAASRLPRPRPVRKGNLVPAPALGQGTHAVAGRSTAFSRRD